MTKAHALDRCVNIADVRERARQRLPLPVFDYVDGGAESEITAQRNISAFDDVPLLPKCLRDVTSVKLGTRILGQDLAWPMFCAPTGGSRMYHGEGELAVARAAAATGTLYGLSTMSTHSLEAVAAAAGPKMFQLYIFKDRAITRDLIERCKVAGYPALALTVDVAVRGKRERELRSGMGVPLRLSWKTMASFAFHPVWAIGHALHGPLSMPNFAAYAGTNNFSLQTRYIAKQLDPGVTWDDARDMIDQWRGPFAIKGIMNAEDARRAADIGATAVIVSNHGGRQLDGSAAAIEALPEIVKAVGDRVEVILEGGVRRGVHILKALALGAKACSVGRPYLYGLAAGGQNGVERVLNILRAELVTAMQLSGCIDVNAIDPDIILRDGTAS